MSSYIDKGHQGCHSTSLLVVKSNENFQALVGTKQVINYLGLKKLSDRQDCEVSSFLTSNLYGRMKKEYLLPAGGKPSFLGGRVDRADQGDARRAALREFSEEFGLSKENYRKIEQNIKYLLDNMVLFDTTEWNILSRGRSITKKSNFYFIDYVCLTKIGLALNVQQTNLKIQNFEKNFRPNKKVFKAPEIHQLNWVDTSELGSHMASTDENYIRGQVNNLSWYISEQVNSSFKKRISEDLFNEIKSTDTSYKRAVAQKLHLKLTSPKVV